MKEGRKEKKRKEETPFNTGVSRSKRKRGDCTELNLNFQRLKSNLQTSSQRLKSIHGNRNQTSPKCKS